MIWPYLSYKTYILLISSGHFCKSFFKDLYIKALLPAFNMDRMGYTHFRGGYKLKAKLDSTVNPITNQLEDVWT